jgi:CubicO group peptidase (beta-lactamase class C family)
MNLTRRREFLAAGIQIVGGLSILPLLGCSSGKRVSAKAKPDSAWTDNIADLEKRIPQLLAELKVPGLSIAIIKDARIAWHKGFGVRDRASETSVDEETMFSAQSMSKPVFAYAVMKLCERGVLNLDTPLTKYTSGLFGKDDPRFHLITARRVLSHTTGFPNWRSPSEPLRVNFTPGEKWLYSGEGYHYLQSTVTRLTGHVDSTICRKYEEGYRVCATDFDEYMRANLLRPFGITSSGFVWTEAFGKRMARAHDKNEKPLKDREFSSTDAARYGAAGTLLTTPTDYAKFLIEVMNPKPADAYRLNPASIQEMLRAHVDAPGQPIRSSWALGWQILHVDGKDVICHGGDIEGFHSLAAFSVPRKSGFVVMTNGENGTEIIWKRLLGNLIDRFL